MQRKCLFKTILLYGGGVDSTAVALAEIYSRRRHPLHLLHVDYGQKAAANERKTLQLIADKYPNVIAHTTDAHWIAFNNQNNLLKGQPQVEDSKEYVMEGRNFYLACIASRYASRIGFAFPSEGRDTPPAPDITPDWCDDATCVLSRMMGRAIRVFSYCDSLTKEQLADIGWQLDAKIMDLSHSCYEEEACGHCERCAWKKEFKIIFDEVKKLNKPRR